MIMPVDESGYYYELDYSTTYKLTLLPGAVTDKAGNSNKMKIEIIFTTEPHPDDTPPYFRYWDPGEGHPGGVPVDWGIILYFNEAIYLIDENLITLKDDFGVVDAVYYDIVPGDMGLIVEPSEVLGRWRYGTTYTLTIPPEAVVDSDNNHPIDNIVVSFKTEEDTIPPEFEASYPEDEDQYFPVDEAIRLYFSEPIELVPDYEYFISLKLESDPETPIPFVAQVGENGEQLEMLIIKPADGDGNPVNFEYESTYTLIVLSGAVKDRAGNSIEEAIKLTFQTQGNT